MLEFLIIHTVCCSRFAVKSDQQSWQNVTWLQRKKVYNNWSLAGCFLLNFYTLIILYLLLGNLEGELLLLLLQVRLFFDLSFVNVRLLKIVVKFVVVVIVFVVLKRFNDFEKPATKIKR